MVLGGSDTGISGMGLLVILFEISLTSMQMSQVFLFFSFPKISFCVLIGMYLSEFKHKGAEMQRGDRTSLQSCVEPRTESILLFVLRGTSHQKLPWCSGTSECLGS